MAEQVWRPYWERASENLRAAETLLRSEPPLFNAATSRAYYAAFHAAIALLLARTEYRPKGQEWAHDQYRLSSISTAFDDGNCWTRNMAPRCSTS
jgi:hypothetical protein